MLYRLMVFPNLPFRMSLSMSKLFLLANLGSSQATLRCLLAKEYSSSSSIQSTINLDRGSLREQRQDEMMRIAFVRSVRELFEASGACMETKHPGVVLRPSCR